LSAAITCQPNGKDRCAAWLATIAVAGRGFPGAGDRGDIQLNTVNEVILAASGRDASIQFVESLENGGIEEQFSPGVRPDNQPPNVARDRCP
jgi:hypothetical protein